MVSVNKDTWSKFISSKRLLDTRWSAHADATKALYFGYTQIQEALKDLA